MASNLDRMRDQLNDLLVEGARLQVAFSLNTRPGSRAEIEKAKGPDADAFIAGLPDFRRDYQLWYSAACAVIRQLLPDRISDFKSHYEKPRGRKILNVESYRIEDALQGLQAGNGAKESVAITHFEQQCAILRAAKDRLENSLYDIRKMVQADLFDSELDAAKELLRYRFHRAAGAMSGVVLERHLREICSDKGALPNKKNPTIADLNDALKNSGAIEVSMWRYIQSLADVRNACDHSKEREPTKEEVSEMISGVKRVILNVH